MHCSFAALALTRLRSAVENDLSGPTGYRGLFECQSVWSAIVVEATHIKAWCPDKKALS